MHRDPFERVLEQAVEQSRQLEEGEPAGYIPELRNANLEHTSAAISLADGSCILAGDAQEHRFTLQSSAKVVLLAGLLEEMGPDKVFATVGTEPSGGSFSSVARLETHGPSPTNPLVNAGAIALCSLIPGDAESKIAWLRRWVSNLYGRPLPVNDRVLNSERETADRNRAIAYFLRGSGAIEGRVEDILLAYFTLCSFEASVEEVSRMACILAQGGVAVGGRRALSSESASSTVSLMATCGMYDESGSHLLRTGLPAKSGVSGVICAVAVGKAGIAVSSPRVNAKGGSVRGHSILEAVSKRLEWHFAFGKAAFGQAALGQLDPGGASS
ncbi:MAG: glutaminase A [Deltaproteobacteria bacterium]|nr:glutaminase A [Deltaproteobacteria bacterium]